MEHEIIVYHNPRCSKSRQALSFLDQKGLDYKIIEYLKTPVSEQELKLILKKLRINATSLIRKGEDDFKQNFKGKNLTEQEWVLAMVNFPKLMERPIVIKGNKAVIARPYDRIETLL
jgi:arsenate reductase